jgi:hypothetical protein
LPCTTAYMAAICRNGQGTGTAVIEAKLTQQLAHIEQAPFYGVFIDLRKAFDAMD